jgi:ABC-type multidrug transport system ATPase subunit
MVENFALSFQNLSYRVNPKIFSKEKCRKEILKDISGSFVSNELTAIIGLSGSGKSSLLNCLSGFYTKNVSGSISISDSRMNMRKSSSYIMQEFNLHSLLTVKETMMLSLNLKNSVRKSLVINF